MILDILIFYISLSYLNEGINAQQCSDTDYVRAIYEASDLVWARYPRVIPSEMGQFWTVCLKNQLFGPKQVSYTPLGVSGPFLTLKSHFWAKIGNLGF